MTDSLLFSQNDLDRVEANYFRTIAKMQSQIQDLQKNLEDTQNQLASAKGLRVMTKQDEVMFAMYFVIRSIDHNIDILMSNVRDIFYTDFQPGACPDVDYLRHGIIDQLEIYKRYLRAVMSTKGFNVYYDSTNQKFRYNWVNYKIPVYPDYRDGKILMARLNLSWMGRDK